MSAKSTYFISSDDDYLSANTAREIFEELCKDITDDMSKEIIDCTCNNASDVEKACSNAVEGARTMSLFGGKKVIWMRNANFFNNTVGKSELAKTCIEKLLDFLEGLDADVASVVISACPVDRGTSAYKRFQKFADCQDFKIKDDFGNSAERLLETTKSLLLEKCKTLEVKISAEALEALVSIVAGSPRMAIQELTKLATYVGFNGAEISEKNVLEMVPIFGDSGKFSDIAEAFYSGNLDLALETMHRYFFTNKSASARPIISTLQSQNSILIQIRALIEEGAVNASARGVSKSAMENAAMMYGEMFESAAPKTNYNVFSQNAWYAGQKLGPFAAKFSMKKLLSFQFNFAKAFEDLLKSGAQDESVMRDLFVRSLSV